MGLLDHYKQYEALSEEEVNAQLRREAHERRAQALARVEALDLAHTTWPALPHPYVVNALTFVARRGLHRYQDGGAAELRGELAHRHGVPLDQVVVGNGVAQLLSSAARALLSAGDELVTPWPSYPLYPLMARRAGARAVPVPGFSPEAVLAAVNSSTRVVVLCNPNDPTGERMAATSVEAMVQALPERVVVLVDEALVDFVDAEPVDACVALAQEHPRMVIFRSFSKAWGLAGLRCGYAVGGPGSSALLDGLGPELGVGDLAQAGALEALRSCTELVAARAVGVARERRRLIGEVRLRGWDVADSQANILWLGRAGLDGSELARRLRDVGVIVAAGPSLGDHGRIRAAVHDEPAGNRLLAALDRAVDGAG
jgi:histidinol-phosphate aminotransferase